MRLLGEYVLLKPVESTEKKSGIILVTDQKEALGEAVVYKAGLNTLEIIEEGCSVVYNAHSAEQVKVRGEEYLLVHQSGIIAIL